MNDINQLDAFLGLIRGYSGMIEESFEFIQRYLVANNAPIVSNERLRSFDTAIRRIHDTFAPTHKVYFIKYFYEMYPARQDRTEENFFHYANVGKKSYIDIITLLYRADEYLITTHLKLIYAVNVRQVDEANEEYPPYTYSNVRNNINMATQLQVNNQPDEDGVVVKLEEDA